MSQATLTVNNLSKRYRLGEVGMTSLKDDIDRWLNKLRKTDERKVSESNDFWALRNVSFELNRGDVLGIIGKNGAGKSTLLKILSRITEPTYGEATLRGRVASLLEVGTGFHPDLSGRENIFLNGAILGMNRNEIRLRFDEIVAFSGIEKFIDTPVKRYSSGMYVRLAFAIAAHLESEILIVDEVLAVGDFEFQKKCLKKMDDLSTGGGRTVLYISHSMNTVETLCNKCMFLKNGEQQIISDNVPAVIKKYLDLETKKIESEWNNSGKIKENEWFVPTRMAVMDADNAVKIRPFKGYEGVNILIEGTVLNLHHGLQIGIGIFNGNDELLFWSTINDKREEDWIPLEKGDLKLNVTIPPSLLNEGLYRAELFLGIYHQEWIHKPGEDAPAVSFEIMGGLSDSPFWIGARPGLIAPTLDWKRI